MRDIDVDRLRRSWATVAAHGDRVALRFYSRLFVLAPKTRDLFPLAMQAQRDRLVNALGRTVTQIGDPDRLVPFLQQLGRDHRRFGVFAEHYEPVGEALMATLADFLGQEWTADLAHDWTSAYCFVARVMHDAADESARAEPPWWVAEVAGHERRTFDIAVLTVRPEQPYAYVPGQSMPVETLHQPRLWRYYSPASARDDGSFDLHIRRVPGGRVSAALVDRVQKGDSLQLGPPVGHRLTLDPEVQADLLLLAGGTGLAPLKALVEQVARQADMGAAAGREAELVVSAHRISDLYDLDALQALAAGHGWLTITPLVGADVSEIVADPGRWHHREVYVCGNDAFVASAVQRLGDAGCPLDRVHYEKDEP